MIRIGWRTVGQFLGEIIFIAVAKGGSPPRKGIFEFVVFIATRSKRRVQDSLPLEEPGLFGEGVEHFSGGVIGGCLAYLVAIGNRD